MSKQTWVLDREALETLLQALRQDGYLLVGPRLQQGVIVYEPLQSLSDLPEGWTDRQEKGFYRSERRDDQALFGYTVGPQSWKKYLFPPEQPLLQAHQGPDGLQLLRILPEAPRYALIGVRGCELKAIQIQDQIFLAGPYADPHYQARREQAFILAVNCTEPGQTCFCTSFGAGPAVGPGYDLSLTERCQTEPVPDYLLRSGSDRGAKYLQQLQNRLATETELAAEADALQQAATQMGRSLDPKAARANIQNAYGSQPKFWQELGERCLACTSCTMVCPTCFCTDIEDQTTLDGQSATRSRHWDSCFNLDFTYTAGQPLRQSRSSRYRQWLSHKLSSWYEQFDSAGCVGCGRCISWCPVGIDLTEICTELEEMEKKLK